MLREPPCVRVYVAPNPVALVAVGSAQDNGDKRPHYGISRVGSPVDPVLPGMLNTLLGPCPLLPVAVEVPALHLAAQHLKTEAEVALDGAGEDDFAGVVLGVL